MTLLIVFLGILILVLLITWARLNAFLAFLVVSLFVGLLLGIPSAQIAQSLYRGIGNTLGQLAVIIVLGAMLGKLVAESGAAQRIATVMMDLFGAKYIQWAMVATGFIIGIPLFYDVGFVLMIPLIFSVVYKFKVPAVYIGIPMLAALSATHGFLPPHPSPAALVTIFQADMGKTLLYGLAIAIPAVIIAGPLFTRTLGGIVSSPLEGFLAPNKTENELPSAGTSFLTALLPVILLILATLLPMLFPSLRTSGGVIKFISDPGIILLLTVLIATFSLGVRQGRRIGEVMHIYEGAVKDVSVILLIVAGAGALKEVFIDSGVSGVIAGSLKDWPVHPLVLGWLIAAIIRVCLGSATVAGLTTAGIIAPLLKQGHVNPNLMVLSIGAGSLMFSHVNDGGFWLFKEYFNVSIKDTLRSWSVMETLLAVIGLGGVLLLNLFV